MANHAMMKHLLAAAALATLVAGLVSCGASGPGSTLPFDEEPIGGGSSTLTGSLVDAGDPSQSISDAYVYIPAGSSSRGASTRAAYSRAAVYAWDITDEDGRYTLENVPDGTQTLYVDPPPGSSYGATRITLDVDQGTESTLRLALPPADLADRGVNITVAPASKTVEPGDTITFEATITDDAGSTLGLTPTWVTTGGIGTIDEDALFTAGWKEGGGGVFAYVGEEYGEAVVTVAASGTADQSPPEVGLSLSPANGRAPLAVTATATASDPDGSIASVSLDWGDGETFTGTAFPETLTHTYASPGTHQAEASATDDDGLSDYATVDLRVESPDNQSPTCSLDASTLSGTIPLDVVFDGSGSDPDGSIATWELDFGDESTIWQSSSAPSGVTHTYSTGGNYTARLTVIDDSGGSANSQVEISANDPAYQNPTATLGATPTTGTAALTVTFNGSGVDNNGGSITEYRLDFQGDGTADWSGTSAPTDLTYTYAAAGTYLPKLTVVDSQGLSDSDTVEIVVDPAPELDLSTSSLDFG
ncbi:MAG: PKD domain-containing protein, partial [Armatimonadia bacterium]|nr:PKD domain-containing protein [Armatimonadia bacterium]